ncbi:cuticle collagen 6 protein [Trichuris trichiura]|uniref:Cuticle collagen 6 protein n=1 Tax=Trichuris trichiura TaxID=36087 RepID=A0A077Z4R4_TRITR|nr:cuticle collagen 6 protein [Trichuris trichiura]
MSEQLLGVRVLDSGSDVYCTYCEKGSANICTESLTRKTCDFGYVYDRSDYVSTMTTMYNLVCDRAWMRDLIKSLWMFGVLLGSLTLGTLSDRYGRKTIFIISSFAEVTLACSLPFVNSYYAVAFVEFATGLCSAGVFMAAFIIVMELFDGPARTIAGIGLQSSCTAGYFLNGVIAYRMRDWKQLQLTCSIIGLAFIPYPESPCKFFRIMPESLTWLVQRGKTAKVFQLRKRIARINGRQEFAEMCEIPMAREENIPAHASLIDLLRHKRLALTFTLTAYNWLTGAMAYYGLSWYTSSLPGNTYVNYFISAAVELPAYILSAVMFECFGRRSALSSMYLLAGLCLLVAGLLRAGKLSINYPIIVLIHSLFVRPLSASVDLETSSLSDQKIMITIVAIAGRTCVAAAYAMAYNYAAEMLPTECRHAGTGICSMCSRLGAIAAPQINLLASYGLRRKAQMMEVQIF